MLGKTIASIKLTLGTKTRIFPLPFLISSSRVLILAKEFRNDYVVACRTAVHSATEKNETGGYVTDQCLFKMTQRRSTAEWLDC